MTETNFRAMVLAAGVGSRLHPLSSTIPKPLIQIAGRAIMEHILLLLRKHGVKEVISNTHHLADKIHEYFADDAHKHGIDLQFVHEAELSGVAGGIRACSDFLKQGTACIIMGDALSDIDLGALYQEHRKAVSNGCLVTIAKMQVEDTSQFGVIVTDEHNRVVSFQEKPSAAEALSNWANTGVYFFEPEVYDYIPSITEAPKYDVAHDLFPKLLEQGKYMQAIAVDTDTYWADLGTQEQYLGSMNDIASGKVKLDGLALICGTAEIDASAKLIDNNQIAAGVQIAANAQIQNSVLWSNVKVEEGAEITNSIIGADTVIKAGEKIQNQILIASGESSLQAC